MVIKKSDSWTERNFDWLARGELKIKQRSTRLSQQLFAAISRGVIRINVLRIRRRTIVAITAINWLR